MTYANGASYSGKFLKCLQHGQGIYTFPDGSRYEGAWADGQQNGQGTYYGPDGEIIFSGQWKKSKPQQ